MSNANTQVEQQYFFEDERTAVIIDGTFLYTLNYYTSVLETDEYTPLKPLMDWLGYNGYVLTAKKAWEFTDKFGARRVSGSILAEMTTDILTLAATKTIQHIVIFSADHNLRYPIEMAQKLHGTRISVVGAKGTPPYCPDEVRRQANRFIEIDEIRHNFTRRQTNMRSPMSATVVAA
jgi:uncharacterized LabA/DUF88 family protein